MTVTNFDVFINMFMTTMKYWAKFMWYYNWSMAKGFQIFYRCIPDRYVYNKVDTIIFSNFHNVSYSKYYSEKPFTIEDF